MRRNIIIVNGAIFLSTFGYASHYLYNRKSYIEELKKNLYFKRKNNAPVPQKMKNLISQVMDDIKFKKDRTKIIPFISNTEDLLFIGSMEWDDSVLLGIPESFLYNEAVKSAVVTVDKTTLPKDSETAETLMKSLHLSEDAKKFALGCTLQEISDLIIPLSIAVPCLIGLQCNIGSILLHVHSKNLGRSVGTPVHVAVFFIVLLMSPFLYSFSVELQKFFIDCLVAKINDSYLQGGIEYYSKTIERNKIIASISKESPFESNGDLKRPIYKWFSVSFLTKVEYLKDLQAGKSDFALLKKFLFS